MLSPDNRFWKAENKMLSEFQRREYKSGYKVLSTETTEGVWECVWFQSQYLILTMKFMVVCNTY